jgi:cytochrome P450
MPEIPDGLEITAFDEAFYANPYGVYERLRRLDPVHQDKVAFYGSSWTISSHELVMSLLKDKRLSVDPRTVGIRRDPRADNAVTF